MDTGQPGISRVGNFDAIGQLVGEGAKSAAQHHGDTRLAIGLPANMLDGFLHQRNMPAMQADMKFAIVPASMAFTPSRARSDLRLGASAPMPPI